VLDPSITYFDPSGVTLEFTSAVGPDVVQIDALIYIKTRLGECR